MSYVYRAFVQYTDGDGRLANLTAAATITAYEPGGTTISSPTFTNLATGIYRAQVTHDTLEPVLFKIVPHADDQADFEDVVVMHDEVVHVVDEILVDTGEIQAVTDQFVFTTPNRVDASADVDVQAVADAIEPLIPTPENIWQYAKRTLTMTPAEVLAYISQTSITQMRGNTWEFELTDVTLTGDKQQFIIKRHTSQPDEDAILFVDDDTGLLIVNGAEAEDETQADLDYTGTTLALKLDAMITAQLPAGNYIYGVQTVSADSEETIVSEAYGGVFTIAADVVRATE
jgi:hypothetical protein